MKETPFSSAEILSVGTELLLGEISNTDAAYLSRALSELGIPCYRHTVVGDNPERLTQALSEAYERADLILLTGGLGPTCDDLTKETAVRLMGKTLVLHEPSYARIQAVLKERGLPETDNQKKQAMLPPDAVVFENDYGTAPAFAMENTDGKTLILMPGPPKELEPLFAEKVRPYLTKRTVGTLHSINLGMFGIGEAAVEACLRDRMENNSNPTVAPYCGEGGEVRVRITAYGETEEECIAMCEKEAAEIRLVSTEPLHRGILEDYIYGEDCNTVADAVVKVLTEKGMTVTTSESCTGGYVAKRITDVPGASACFMGSIVTYSEKTKRDVGGVPQEILDRYSVYSTETAIAMAKGARDLLCADVSVGITGLTTGDAMRIYDGKEERLAPGTVFLACVCGDKVATYTLHLDPARRAPSEAREYVRRRASSQALWMIYQMIRSL